jgi:hypothetical protein
MSPSFSSLNCGANMGPFSMISATRAPRYLAATLEILSPMRPINVADRVATRCPTEFESHQVIKCFCVCSRLHRVSSTSTHCAFQSLASASGIPRMQAVCCAAVGRSEGSYSLISSAFGGGRSGSRVSSAACCCAATLGIYTACSLSNVHSFRKNSIRNSWIWLEWSAVTRVTPFNSALIRCLSSRQLPLQSKPPSTHRDSSSCSPAFMNADGVNIVALRGVRPSAVSAASASFSSCKTAASLGPAEIEESNG